MHKQNGGSQKMKAATALRVNNLGGKRKTAAFAATGIPGVLKKPSGPISLYEDRHPWPVKCPNCGEEFVEQIGSLKTRRSINCPSLECQAVFAPDSNFGRTLASARTGTCDPYRQIWSSSRS